MLMSAELMGYVTWSICFLNLLWVRYNCAKFHHCRISKTDFREEGPFCPPLIREQPQKSSSWIGLKLVNDIYSNYFTCFTIPQKVLFCFLAQKYKLGTESRFYCSRIVFMNRFWLFLLNTDHFWSFQFSSIFKEVKAKEKNFQKSLNKLFVYFIRY